MSYKLLITGSRETTPEMLDLARRAVKRAKELNWSIIVGDAHGIDAAVIAACDEYNVPIMVYGITINPRNGSRRSASYVQIEVNYLPLRARYLYRDQVMAKEADRCFAICLNGSKGTLFTYRAALELGKLADIRHFRN